MKPRKEQKSPHKPDSPDEVERGDNPTPEVEPGKIPDKREDELIDDETLDKADRGDSF